MSIAMLHQRDSFTYDIVIEKKMWLDRTGITPYPWSDLEGELLGGGGPNPLLKIQISYKSP